MLTDIGTLNHDLAVYQERAISLAKREASFKSKALISKQVAHDIKSPLSALEIILGTENELPKEKSELLCSAVKRIKEITNDLTRSSTSLLDPPSLLISNVIDAVKLIVSEKIIEYGENRINIKVNSRVNLNHQILALEVKVFKRIISNLLNNAIEASCKDKPINVNISEDEKDSKLVIEIIDKGKGVPKADFDSIFKEGVSIGKKEGSGLGLFHAKQNLEFWGANITIKSSNINGTNMLLTLPFKTSDS